MKTKEKPIVKTTEDPDAILEQWVVFNTSDGIAAYRYHNGDVNIGIKVDVLVARMFPGTWEGWNAYIIDCLVDWAVKNLPVEYNYDYEAYFIKGMPIY